MTDLKAYKPDAEGNNMNLDFKGAKLQLKESVASMILNVTIRTWDNLLQIPQEYSSITLAIWLLIIGNIIHIEMALSTF